MFLRPRAYTTTARLGQSTKAIQPTNAFIVANDSAGSSQSGGTPPPTSTVTTSAQTTTTYTTTSAVTSSPGTDSVLVPGAGRHVF